MSNSRFPGGGTNENKPEPGAPPAAFTLPPGADFDINEDCDKITCPPLLLEEEEKSNIDDEEEDDDDDDDNGEDNGDEKDDWSFKSKPENFP